jgi:hypothetical protein
MWYNLPQKHKNKQNKEIKAMCYKINNEKDFDEMHNKICVSRWGEWKQISNEPTTYECSECGATYIPEQEYFNSSANEQFDDNGRKIGSGEYQKIEFEGYIPE